MPPITLKLCIGIALLLPTLTHASFLPPDLIDGVANVISWVVLIGFLSSYTDCVHSFAMTAIPHI